MDNIHRTRAMFNDMLNLPRGKYVPVEVAAGGSIGFARGAFQYPMIEIYCRYLAVVSMTVCQIWI